MPEDIVDSNLNKLIDVLTREQAVFQEYLELLIERQEYLIRSEEDGNGADMDRINELAVEAASLEDSRRIILSRISSGTMTEAERLSISKILSIFENPRFKDLERFKDAMLEIYQHVSEQKTRNEFLIEQSIELISQTMQYIHEVNNTGEKRENPTNSSRYNRKRGTHIKDDNKCADLIMAPK